MRKLHRAHTRFSYWYDRVSDPRRTLVPRKLLESIQEGSQHYRYRGVRCVKNPFDLAIYLRLLDDLRPLTIVEIGSAAGGSALFLSEQTKLLGLNTTVISIDINLSPLPSSSNLIFLQGDVNHLSESELPKYLKQIAKPLLVIEDGPHTYEGTLAALNFFHPLLEAGDIIVVEDGNLRELGYLGLLNGPNRARREFLKNFGVDYIVREDLCDSFGRNVTWNTDGYLERR